MTSDDIVKGYAAAWKALFQGFCNSLASFFVGLPVFSDGDNVNITLPTSEQRSGVIVSIEGYFKASHDKPEGWRYTVQLLSTMDGGAKPLEPKVVLPEGWLSKSDGGAFAE